MLKTFCQIARIVILLLGSRLIFINQKILMNRKNIIKKNF